MPSIAVMLLFQTATSAEFIIRELGSLVIATLISATATAANPSIAWQQLLSIASTSI
jgi:hypothetical protein